MLHIKNVNVKLFFSLCNREAKTSIHLFLKCPFAKSCWQAAGVPRDEPVYGSFQEWAFNVFNGWDASNGRMEVYFVGSYRIAETI